MLNIITLQYIYVISYVICAYIKRYMYVYIMLPALRNQLPLQSLVFIIKLHIHIDLSNMHLYVIYAIYRHIQHDLHFLISCHCFITNLDTFLLYSPLHTVCLSLIYTIATVFQFYYSSDMTYEMRRRKPEPTLLPTQAILFNLSHHVGMV